MSCLILLTNSIIDSSQFKPWKMNITKTRTHLQLWSIAHQVWTWCVWNVMCLTCFCCIHKAFPTSRSLTTGCTRWVNKCKTVYHIFLLDSNCWVWMNAKRNLCSNCFWKRKKESYWTAVTGVGHCTHFSTHFSLLCPASVSWFPCCTSFCAWFSVQSSSSLCYDTFTCFQKLSNPHIWTIILLSLPDTCFLLCHHPISYILCSWTTSKHKVAWFLLVAARGTSFGIPDLKY